MFATRVGGTEKFCLMGDTPAMIKMMIIEIIDRTYPTSAIYPTTFATLSKFILYIARNNITRTPASHKCCDIFHFLELYKNEYLGVHYTH